MRERTALARKYAGSCLHEHLFRRPVHARGVCVSHYNQFNAWIRDEKQIDGKVVTDALLVLLKWWLPKEKTLEDELRAALAKYEQSKSA